MPTEMELLEIVQQIKMRSELIRDPLKIIQNTHTHTHTIDKKAFYFLLFFHFVALDISPLHSGRVNGF